MTKAAQRVPRDFAIILNASCSPDFPSTPEEALEVVDALRKIVKSGLDEYISQTASFNVHEAMIEIAEGKPLYETAAERGLTQSSMIYTIATRALIPLRIVANAGRLKRTRLSVAYNRANEDEARLCLLGDLNAFVRSLDYQNPTARRYNDWRKAQNPHSHIASVQTVIRLFGSWNNAISAVTNAPPQRSRSATSYTSEQLATQLAYWVLFEKKPHGKNTMDNFVSYLRNHPELPSYRTFSKGLPLGFRTTVKFINQEIMERPCGIDEIARAVKRAQAIHRRVNPQSHLDNKAE